MFIRAELRQLIQPLEDHISVRDADKCVVAIAGTIVLVAQVGSRNSATVDFNFTERWGTEVILSYDFCDAHIEAIRPPIRIGELTYSTTGLILEVSPSCSSSLAPIPSNLEYIAPKGCASHKIFVTQTVTFKRQSQTKVPISTTQTGLIQVWPYRELYET